jgi:hypothetical protein
MRVLRALLGALLWILAAVVGLLGVVLSVTVILLPLGVPLLMLARRLFTRSVALVLPRKVTHPVQESGKSARKKGRKATDALPDLDTKKARKKGRKATDALPDLDTRKARKAARKKAKRAGKSLRRQRKKLG